MIDAMTTEEDFWRTAFPQIADRAAEKHPEIRGRLADYAAEFRRFLGLLKGSSEAIAMVSPRIDHLWHEFVTCTVTYRNYCSKFAGHFLDHMPRTDWNPLPEAAVPNFFRAYEAKHGALPDCWYDGLGADVVSKLRCGEIPAGFRWSGYVPSAE